MTRGESAECCEINALELKCDPDIFDTTCAECKQTSRRVYKSCIGRCLFWMKNVKVFSPSSPDKSKYQTCGKTRGVNDMFNHEANKTSVKIFTQPFAGNV